MLPAYARPQRRRRNHSLPRTATSRSRIHQRSQIDNSRYSISSADYPYWDRLFEDPAFAQRVGDRWQELRNTILTTEQMMANIDAAVALLSDGNPNLERPAAGEPSNPLSRNFKEWRNLGTYLWPKIKSGYPVFLSPSTLLASSGGDGFVGLTINCAFDAARPRQFIENRVE